jgi:S-adenosylmethionine:tRNA ribosyltransferase-isomerase
MNLADFDYNLPSDLIATEPSRQRDQARLLVLRRGAALEHKVFSELVDYLKAGDVLVLNDSKVIPARLLGKKDSGGEVEVFLSKNLGTVWECLVKGRVKAGTRLQLSPHLSAVVEAKKDDGVCLIAFSLATDQLFKELENIGQVPLPPYILKQRQGATLVDDKQEYQTVYAAEEHKGSVAAPTAGLHFTKELLSKLEAKGVKLAYVTLHVGLGTFLPVKTEKIEDHQIHSEWAEVPAATCQTILAAKQAGGRIIAVGTTAARTLEYFAPKILALAGKAPAEIIALKNWVDIYIYEPYQFQLVNGLVTNFHLPKSTLLMLVSALAGREQILAAYQEAIAHKYRFYSYGDAMLIF